jgi:hypothetical protein
VTAINPNFGPIAGGTLVTITGTNFQLGATLVIGGVAATGVTVVNSTTITATTGAHAAGPADVVMTIPDGQSGTLAGGFTYSTGAAFSTLTPCRVVDTRHAIGPYGGPALVAGADRAFVFAGQCEIPVEAKAVSLNVAVVTPTNGPGFLTLYPGGGPLPLAATINYSAGQIRANNAIVSLGGAGDLLVRCGQGGGTADVVIDVNGYFQ